MEIDKLISYIDELKAELLSYPDKEIAVVICKAITSLDKDGIEAIYPNGFFAYSGQKILTGALLALNADDAVRTSAILALSKIK